MVNIVALRSNFKQQQHDPLKVSKKSIVHILEEYE